MKKILLILILVNASIRPAIGQSFTVRDLLAVSHLKHADVNSFMYKKNFIFNIKDAPPDSSVTSYIQRMKNRKSVIDTFKSIDFYEKQSVKYFVLHTSSASEYNEGRQWLSKEKFIYNPKKDLSTSPTILFEKANITIESTQQQKDSFIIYTFTLKEKKTPDSVAFAEDLLQFTSREYLTSYFGEKNVSDDLYYISDKQSKPCSVLLPGTALQVLFVWDNDSTDNRLAYIMLSNQLPTKAGRDKGKIEGSVNNWKFKCGLHWGMTLKDLLRLNQMDFYIYGNKSDYAMMIKPVKTGNINFSKMAIMMNCSDCEASEIFDQDELSALEAAKAQMPLKVADIILYP